MTGNEAGLESEAGGSVKAIDLLRRSSKLCRKYNKSHKNFREISELLSELEGTDGQRGRQQEKTGEDSKKVPHLRWNYIPKRASPVETAIAEKSNRKSTSITPTKSPNSTVVSKEGVSFHIGLDILSLVEGIPCLILDLLQEDIRQNPTPKASEVLTPQSLMASRHSKKKESPQGKMNSINSLEYSKDVDETQDYRGPTQPLVLQKSEEFFKWTIPVKRVEVLQSASNRPEDKKASADFNERVLGWKPQTKDGFIRPPMGSPEWRKKYRNT
jgi:hypothetical protein